MDCVVHGVAKNWTLLSDFHFHFGTLVRVQEAVGGEGRSLAPTLHAQAWAGAKLQAQRCVPWGDF